MPRSRSLRTNGSGRGCILESGTAEESGDECFVPQRFNDLAGRWVTNLGKFNMTSPHMYVTGAAAERWPSRDASRRTDCFIELTDSALRSVFASLLRVKLLLAENPRVCGGSTGADAFQYDSPMHRCRRMHAIADCMGACNSRISVSEADVREAQERINESSVIDVVACLRIGNNHRFLMLERHCPCGSATACCIRDGMRVSGKGSRARGARGQQHDAGEET